MADPLTPPVPSVQGTDANRTPGRATSEQDHSIQALLERKEREVQEIRETHLRSLEVELKGREAEVNALEATLAALREDFQHNLTLLDGRDEELARYDKESAKLRMAMLQQKRQNEQLRIMWQESAATVKGEVQRSNAAVAHHQSKVAELKVVLQNKDWERDEALRTQKEEYDAVRQTLEARLREREEELETQRREFLGSAEAQLKQVEREWESKVTVLAAQLNAEQRRTATLEQYLHEERARAGTAAEAASKAEAAREAAAVALEKSQRDSKNTERLLEGQLAGLGATHELALKAKQKEVDNWSTRARDWEAMVQSLQEELASRAAVHDERVQHNAKLHADELEVANQKLREAEARLSEVKEGAKAELREQLAVCEASLTTARHSEIIAKKQSDQRVAELTIELGQRERQVGQLQEELAALRQAAPDTSAVEELADCRAQLQAKKEACAALEDAQHMLEAALKEAEARALAAAARAPAPTCRDPEPAPDAGAASARVDGAATATKDPLHAMPTLPRSLESGAVSLAAEAPAIAAAEIPAAARPEPAAAPPLLASCVATDPLAQEGAAATPLPATAVPTAPVPELTGPQVVVSQTVVGFKFDEHTSSSASPQLVSHAEVRTSVSSESDLRSPTPHTPSHLAGRDSRGSLDSVPTRIDWSQMMPSRLSGSSELLDMRQSSHSILLTHPEEADSPPTHSPTPNLPNSSEARLQGQLGEMKRQNERLTLVVREMRAEMEMLQQGLAAGLPRPAPVEGAAGGADGGPDESQWLQRRLENLQRVSGVALMVAEQDELSADERGQVVELQHENLTLRRELHRAWKEGAAAQPTQPAADAAQTPTGAAAVALPCPRQDELAGPSSTPAPAAERPPTPEKQPPALSSAAVAAPASAMPPPAPPALPGTTVWEELDSARGDISRLMDERERLLEFTHALRCEMARVQAGATGATKFQPPPPPFGSSQSPTYTGMAPVYFDAMPPAGPPTGPGYHLVSTSQEHLRVRREEEERSGGGNAGPRQPRPKSARARIAQAREGSIELHAMHAAAVDMHDAAGRPQPLLASEQYTQSQRGRLKAMVTKPTVKTQVRNFNIKDDEEAQAQLGTVVTGKPEAGPSWK